MKIALLALILSLFLTGCSATQKVIKDGNNNVIMCINKVAYYYDFDRLAPVFDTDSEVVLCSEVESFLAKNNK